MNTNPRIRLGFRSLIRVGGSGKQAATGGRVEDEIGGRLDRPDLKTFRKWVSRSNFR